MEPAKDIIKRFVEELWNSRRLDVADQIFSRGDCVKTRANPITTRLPVADQGVQFRAR
jgi:hypothetical protein